MHQPIKIFNGKIITPDKIIDGGSILITGDTITAISENNIDIENAIEIDANGKYIQTYSLEKQSLIFEKSILASIPRILLLA